MSALDRKIQRRIWKENYSKKMSFKVYLLAIKKDYKALERQVGRERALAGDKRPVKINAPSSHPVSKAQMTVITPAQDETPPAEE